MFSYMNYMYDAEHITQQWTNNVATEDSSNHPTIVSYIDPCFVQPLLNSCQLVYLRKWKQPYVCEKISSICRKIVFQLPDLYMLIQMKDTIEEEKEFDILALATICCNLGILYKDHEEMRNLECSLKYLSDSHELLEKCDLDCNAILICLKVLIAKSEIQETQRWLNEAIKLCLHYFEQDSFQSQPLYTYLADISMYEDVRISIRVLYQNMIERMKTLYSASGEMDEWIKIVHNCLHKRATTLFNSPYELGCIWSDAAISISTYFINKLRFTEARNCLAAAEHVLERIQRGSSYEFFRNNVMIRRIKVVSAWLTYVVYILRESSFHLLAQQQTSSEPNQEEPQEFLLLFTSLSEHLAYIKHKITASCVSNMFDMFEYAGEVTDFARHQYYLATFIFCPPVRNTKDELSIIFETMFKYASVLKCFAGFTTDLKKRVDIHHLRSTFLRNIYNECKEREQEEARCVPEFVPYVVTILEMWQDATKTLLFEINRNGNFDSLRVTTQEELHYIIPTLYYYKQWLKWES